MQILLKRRYAVKSLAFRASRSLGSIRLSIVRHLATSRKALDRCCCSSVL